MKAQANRTLESDDIRRLGTRLRGVSCDVSKDFQTAPEESVRVVSAGILFVKRSGQISSGNPQSTELVGRSEQEIVGRALTSVFAPESAATLSAALEAAFSTNSGRVVDARFGKSDEGERWCELAISPIDQHTAVVSMRDSTADHRMRRDYQALQARYRAMFDNAAVSLWEEDLSAVRRALDQLRANGVTDFRQYFADNPEFVSEAASLVRLLDVNAATLRMFGASDKHAFLDSLTAFFLPENLAAFREELVAMAEGKPTFESEAILRSFDGRRVDVVLSIGLPADEESACCVPVTLTDISARKQSEEALRESRELIQQAMELARSFSFDWNVVTDQVVISSNRDALVGSSSDRSTHDIGANWLERIYEDDRGTFFDTLAGLTPRRDTYRLQYRVWHTAGHLISLSETGRASFDDTGRLIRIYGICADVTELVRTGEAYRESQARLKEAQTAAGVGLWDWDLRTNNTMFTEDYFPLYGLPRHTTGLTTTKWADLLHPEDKEYVKTCLDEAVAGKKPYEAQFRVIWPDGTEHWLLGRGQVLRDDAGSPIRMIGINMEITAQKRTEQELRETNRALRIANENLEQFAWAAAHDLQEPLRMMTAFSQMLVRRYTGNLDKDGEQCVGFIREGSARMQALLRDLLQFLSAGSEDPSTAETIDSDVALRMALHNLHISIQETQATVTNDPLPSILGHSHEIVQLFQNLIGNALKYRGETAPRIHVSSLRKAGEWVFSVEDNGPGIDPQYHEKIFGLFKRLQRDVPGTGLGLALCSRILESYGGKIWVESELGRGAKFLFTVPDPIAKKSRYGSTWLAAGLVLLLFLRRRA